MNRRTFGSSARLATNESAPLGSGESAASGSNSSKAGWSPHSTGASARNITSQSTRRHATSVAFGRGSAARDVAVERSSCTCESRDSPVGHCHELTYDSQRERAPDRARRRQRKIRATLGMGSNLVVPITDKPKGMRWLKLERLRASDLRSQGVSLADMVRFVEQHCMQVAIDARSG